MTKKSGTIRLSGKLICASPQEIEIIKKFLPEHIRITKAETGCLSFEVTQTTDPLVWRVEECLPTSKLLSSISNAPVAQLGGKRH